MYPKTVLVPEGVTVPTAEVVVAPVTVTIAPPANVGVPTAKVADDPETATIAPAVSVVEPTADVKIDPVLAYFAAPDSVVEPTADVVAEPVEVTVTLAVDTADLNAMTADVLLKDGATLNLTGVAEVVPLKI